MAITGLADRIRGTGSGDGFPRPTKRWLTAAIIFVGFAALYLATPTSNYTFDAVSYASNVRDALRIGPEPLFNPHHLLFNGAGYLVWRAAAVFSPTIEKLS